MTGRDVPSRRAVLAGVGTGVALTAGCLGSNEAAGRCSSRGVGSESEALKAVAPLRGEEQISLGVLVSDDVPGSDQYNAIVVRTPDDDVVSRILLLDTEGMNQLDPSNYPVLGSSTGELYAIPLGEPPVYGDYTVSLAGPDTAQTAGVEFNCFSEDGSLL